MGGRRRPGSRALELPRLATGSRARSLLAGFLDRGQSWPLPLCGRPDGRSPCSHGGKVACDVDLVRAGRVTDVVERGVVVRALRTGYASRERLPPNVSYRLTVRIGVLGCGGIARVAHLPLLARIGDARVVAIADADPSSLAAAQLLAPGARAVGDYRDVLDMPDVDAVVIALPPALHAEAAIGALQLGLHAYIEKPLATSLADARRVVAASADASRDGTGDTRPIAMMGFNYRWNPLIQQAHARIAAGAIGQPMALRTVFSTAARGIPEWKRQRDSGGGVLLDLAVHHIDLVRFLTAAEVATVSTELRSVRTEHDTALLQMTLTNGTMVQSLFSLSAVDEDRLDVYSADAKLTIDRYRSLRLETVPAAAGGAIGLTIARFLGELGALPYALRKVRAPLGDPSFPAALEAFVRAVRDRSAPTPTVIDGLQAVAVIEAAELSARTGRVVTVDGVFAGGCGSPGPTDSRVPDNGMPRDVAIVPDLSVVLITPDSFETIRRTVTCVVRQSVRSRIELVIVAPAGVTIGIDERLVAPLAGVQVVRLASLMPAGPARAAAIRAAHAPIIAFGEEHCFPALGWAEALLDAHRGEYAAVGPAMRNANPDTIVSWADILIGYGPWLAPVERAERDYLPGHNSSYKRAVLLEYGDALETLMEAETVLMWDLKRKGYRLLLEPAAVAAHTNFGFWSSWVQVMFHGGRAFSHTRASEWSLARRLVFAAASPLIPIVRLARTLGTVRRLGRGPAFAARVVPTLWVGLCFDAVGQMVGYALGAGTSHEKLAAFEWHRLKHTPRGEAPAT